jgi:hypothetical protein
MRKSPLAFYRRLRSRYRRWRMYRRYPWWKQQDEV